MTRTISESGGLVSDNLKPNNRAYTGIIIGAVAGAVGGFGLGYVFGLPGEGLAAGVVLGWAAGEVIGLLASQRSSN